VPRFDPQRWDFRVLWQSENEFKLDWKAFQELDKQRSRECLRHHLVASISIGGIPFAKIVRAREAAPRGEFVIAHSERFTRTSHRFCLRDDCLVALRANGEPAHAEHGYPARLVVPRLYAWKSAKWLRGIEFSSTDKPGFWGRNGYHKPWRSLESRKILGRLVQVLDADLPVAPRLS